MIPCFDDITKDLTTYELSLVPKFVSSFQNKIGKENAITNKRIVELMKEQYKVSEPRIRKIINHIRNRGLVVGLVANSKGYYITHDINELEQYILSLEAREGAIRVVREGMEAHLRNLKSKK